MVTRDTPWPDGYPCWFDLMTPDLAAAREFYGGLFGWEFEDAGEAANHYTLARRDGRVAAAIFPQHGDMVGRPPAWTTYIATSSADDACARAEEAGGLVINGPFDVMVGRMAVVQDPTGGIFALWQAGQRGGVEVANEPGTVVWNELMTREYDRAKAFYAHVFGYTFTEVGEADLAYATLDIDGRPVGGIGALADDIPKEVPSHWRIYFAVADADETLTLATTLGGGILRPAHDAAYGRWGDVSDGQGAMFSVIKP
jgi:predicted enzyme related to lactoylglutathione lyase